MAPLGHKELTEYEWLLQSLTESSMQGYLSCCWIWLIIFANVAKFKRKHFKENYKLNNMFLLWNRATKPILNDQDMDICSHTTRPSAAMILTVWNKWALVFHRKQFQLTVPSQYFDMERNAKLIYFHVKVNLAWHFLISHTSNTIYSIILTRSKLSLCSANHRPGYWSNLACDWPSTVWAYYEQETENGPWLLQTFVFHEEMCQISRTFPSIHNWILFPLSISKPSVHGNIFIVLVTAKASLTRTNYAVNPTLKSTVNIRLENFRGMSVINLIESFATNLWKYFPYLAVNSQTYAYIHQLSLHIIVWITVIATRVGDITIQKNLWNIHSLLTSNTLNGSKSNAIWTVTCFTHSELKKNGCHFTDDPW